MENVNTKVREASAQGNTLKTKKPVTGSMLYKTVG